MVRVYSAYTDHAAVVGIVISMEVPNRWSGGCALWRRWIVAVQRAGLDAHRGRMGIGPAGLWGSGSGGHLFRILPGDQGRQAGPHRCLETGIGLIPPPAPPDGGSGWRKLPPHQGDRASTP